MTANTDFSDEFMPTTKFIGFDPRTSLYQLHNFVNKQCENLMLEKALVYYNGREHYALVTTTNEQLKAKICIHFGVTSLPAGRVNVQSMLWNSEFQYTRGKKLIDQFIKDHPDDKMIVIVMYHISECTMATDCVALLDDLCRNYDFKSTDSCHVIIKPDFVPHIVQCIKSGQLGFRTEPPNFRIHPNLQEKSTTYSRLKVKVEATPEAAYELVERLYKRKYMPSIQVMHRNELHYPWDQQPGEEIVKKPAAKKPKDKKNTNPMWDKTSVAFKPVYTEGEDGTVIRHGTANWTWDWQDDEVEEGKAPKPALAWSSTSAEPPKA